MVGEDIGKPECYGNGYKNGDHLCNVCLYDIQQGRKCEQLSLTDEEKPAEKNTGYSRL